MVRVRLKVSPTGSAPDTDAGEDWGEWDFVSLPNSGDHINVDWHDATQSLTVLRVIHFAAQHPLPRTETPFRQRTQPSICILAVRRE